MATKGILISGEKLAHIRTKSGLSQRDLAAKANISPRSIAKYEVSPGAVVRYAQFRSLVASLKIKPEDLMVSTDALPRAKVLTLSMEISATLHELVVGLAKKEKTDVNSLLVEMVEEGVRERTPSRLVLPSVEIGRGKR